MEYTIRELADLSGVTTRTLRWYDQIGLLKPGRVAENGYRYYGPAQVDRLQDILYYRALGVELAQIKACLDDPSFDRLAALRGAAAAVRCDAEERLLTADGAPLFAVRGHTVYTAPAPASVEGCLAREAVRAAGLTLREEPLRRRELPRAEELFYADHRGITALSRCDGQPLMTLVAERVAEALEGLFPKK